MLCLMVSLSMEQYLSNSVVEFVGSIFVTVCLTPKLIHSVCNFDALSTAFYGQIPKVCVRSWAPQVYLHSLCILLAFLAGGGPFPVPLPGEKTLCT